MQGLANMFLSYEGNCSSKIQINENYNCKGLHTKWLFALFITVFIVNVQLQ